MFSNKPHQRTVRHFGISHIILRAVGVAKQGTLLPVAGVEAVPDIIVDNE